MKKNKTKNKIKTGKIIKTFLLISLILVALLSVAFAMIFIFGSEGITGNKDVLYTYTTEAGQTVTADVFTTGEDHTARFADDINIEEICKKVGSHEIRVIVDGMGYNVTLNVEDTTPPTGKPFNIMCKMDSIPKAEDMVRDIVDVTNVKVSFDRSPNMAVKGKQNVSIKLTDEGGNSTIVNSIVYVTDILNIPEWEIGGIFPEVSKITGDTEDISYLDNSFIEKIESPGEYTIALRVSYGGTFDTFYTKFIAKDTTAPTVIPINSGIYDLNTEIPDASTWILEYYDATKVTFEYESTNFRYPGIHYIIVNATDEGNNKTSVSIKITVFDSKNDENAPIITCPGSISVSVGEMINYKDHITVYDYKDGNIDITEGQKVQIDDSRVNIYLPGEYMVLVTASDSAGKSSSASITVIVKHKELTNNEINKVIDEVIRSIITEGMTDEQKIYAVFSKITNDANMNFSGSSDKSNDPAREAYYGFTNKYGDSYTAACMMKTVLERIGFDVKTVSRITSGAGYYWSLVDFKDGWYHVDAFLKEAKWVVDGKEKETFKLTDGELAEYTKWYDTIKPGVNYYLFDPVLYPPTPVLTESGYIRHPYRVVYITSEGGYINGNTDQSVNHGASAETVTAVAASGYKFIGWSDGVKEATRKDIIKNNLTVTALFEKDSGGLFKKYKIKYVANTGGTISGNLSQYVDAGYYSSPVTAIPDTGYKFVGWSDGLMTPERTDLARNDMTVIANFAPYSGITYRFDYKTTNGGKLEGKTFQIVEENLYGETVIAVPDEGYVFNCWSDGNTNPERTDFADGDVSVIAFFAKEGSAIYSIDYKFTVGGSIQGLTNQRTEAGAYTQTVTAVPERGYKFVSWNDGYLFPERSDIANGDIIYTAIFEPLEKYRIIYLVSGDGGYISGVTTQYLFEGETGTPVTAYALKGYKFVGWSDGVTTSDRFDTPTANLEVTAIFEKLPVFTATYTAGEGGIVEGTTVQNVLIDEYTSTVTAKPNIGYKFICWSDGVQTLERQDQMTGDLTVVAIFEALPSFTVNYFAEDGGSIQGILSQTKYEGESFETVVAIPNEGFEFVSWSDGVTTAERTDIASDNKDITATFVPVKICTVIYAYTAGGRVEGTLTQTVYIGSSTTPVVAIADEGYKFLYWYDGHTSPERSDIAKETIVVYTAVFAPIT